MPAPKFTLPVSGEATKVTTQEGLEAGIDAVSQTLFDQIGAIATGLAPAGNWDASVGTFPSEAERGSYYVVNVAGTVDSQAFAVGDWLVPLVDAASTSIYAANWFRGDYSQILPDGLPRKSYPTVADMRADGAVGYIGTALVVSAGDIIDAGGFRYEVAEPDAVDHDEATAGGAKLYKRSETVQYRSGSGGALFDVPTGGSSSESWVFNSYVNAIHDGVLSAGVAAGGSVGDEQYIGFHKNREVLTATGTAQVWPHVPTDNDLANLRVFKKSALNVQSTLVSPGDYTAAISGAQVDITLAVALASGDRLVVEDKAAKVAYSGVRPDYSWIGGGYDCIITEGVMQQVTGAHHRVTGGDHGTILGGSYSVIEGGSYGVVIAGTNNEIGSGGGVGSVVVGGYRNRASGATSTIIGGQSNAASGAQSAIVGGTQNLVSGTASFATGRENTVAGADSVAFGRGNLVGNNYSAAKGYKALTSWSGQDVRFAYRDTATPSAADRQHFFLDMSASTTSTTTTLMTNIDGVTSFDVPDGATWKCRLQTSAHTTSAGFGASFEAVFLLQNNAGTLTFQGTIDYTTKSHSIYGTAGNIATVTPVITANELTIVVQPRIDSAVPAKWGAVLEVLEVR